VTSLEPRTPHQPGKLQKLSKNDYVSTPFILTVNEKSGIVSVGFSIGCRQFTGGCNGLCAVLKSPGLDMCVMRQFLPSFLSDAVERYETTLTVFVKILGKTALDAEIWPS
jgi:hypothetical protein